MPVAVSRPLRFGRCGSVVGGGRCGSVVVGRSVWVSRLGSVAVGQSPEGRSLWSIAVFGRHRMVVVDYLPWFSHAGKHTPDTEH